MWCPNDTTCYGIDDDDDDELIQLSGVCTRTRSKIINWIWHSASVTKTGSLSLAKGLKSSSEPVNFENRFAINIYFNV